MSKRRELEQQASSFAKKVDHFLHNSTNHPIHGVARQGSRKEGTHRDDSDLDMVFSIAGDPERDEIYPDLIEKISKTLNVDASLGAHGNVINITKGDLELDLVLLPMSTFETQIRNNKLKRMS
ncbi:MAG: hypothetical protein ACTSVL_06740 [Promethearchaeota archaeon]